MIYVFQINDSHGNDSGKPIRIPAHSELEAREIFMREYPYREFRLIAIEPRS